MTRLTLIIPTLVALLVSGAAWGKEKIINWDDWDVYYCTGESRHTTTGEEDLVRPFSGRFFIKKDGSLASMSPSGIKNAPLKLKSRLPFEAYYTYGFNFKGRRPPDAFTQRLTIGKFGSMNYSSTFRDLNVVADAQAENDDRVAHKIINGRCTKKPPTVFDYDIYKKN